MQRTDEYVTCSVAEVLHEMCSDVEVPPSQRKFERRKMSRSALCYPVLLSSSTFFFNGMV